MWPIHVYPHGGFGGQRFSDRGLPSPTRIPFCVPILPPRRGRRRIVCFGFTRIVATMLAIE